MTAEQIIAEFTSAHKTRAEAKAAYYAQATHQSYIIYADAMVRWDRAWKKMFSYES